MAAVRFTTEDLEEPCWSCPTHPGKALVNGKWVGDPCATCQGVGYVPTVTGAAILEFLDRHRPPVITQP